MRCDILSKFFDHLLYKATYACYVRLCDISSQNTEERDIHTKKQLRKKKRKSIYIAPFIYYVYLKALRHGSHSFTWINKRHCSYTTTQKIEPMTIEIKWKLPNHQKTSR